MNSSSWQFVIGGLVVGLIVGFLVGRSLGTPAPEKTAETAPKTVMISTDLQFVNHLQAKLPEQDVFIEDKAAPATQVVRVEGDGGKDPANLAKQVFASSKAVEHDPFKLGKTPLGPFAKGKALGMTLGQWLAATGKGTYKVEGDKAVLDVSFAKLVPNGTYTVWCSRITFPPNVKVIDKPCGGADGSQNVFKADSDGNATFTLTMTPVEPSTKETVSVIALAYHSDGKTYGANPGDFGLNSHVHIFYLFPPPSE